MATERVQGGFEFSCDCCGKVFELPRLGLGSARRDFHESWDVAKEAGWRAVKVVSQRTGKEEWEHRCDECV